MGKPTVEDLIHELGDALAKLEPIGYELTVLIYPAAGGKVYCATNTSPGTLRDLLTQFVQDVIEPRLPVETTH